MYVATLRSLALSTLLLGLAATSVGAETYPSRVVSIVVPYPPGGSVDGVARILAQKLTETTGESFIVENRAGGAGGAVGANHVAKAAPDGYTLMLTASIHIITPFISKNIPYDAVNDFTPISLVASGPLIVSTPPSTPANTLKEFFELVRQQPDKYSFATSSYGSAGHLAIELLKRDAGLDTVVVPYKGAGPALTDLMSGQVQLMADPMLSSLPLVKGGKLKALAVTSTKRVAAAPEIPTLEESGMEGFDFASWYGLWGPKGLPADIVRKLESEVARIVAMPDVSEKLMAQGFEPAGSTSERFASFIAEEAAKYEQIIKDANIRAE